MARTAAAAMAAAAAAAVVARIRAMCIAKRKQAAEGKVARRRLRFA
jgi:hypothetical protein